MKRLALAITLSLTLISVLVLPVSAGDTRPVRGSFTGSAVNVEQRCPGALTIGFAIGGVLSHLGRMTGTGSNCTEFTLGTSAVAIWDGVAVLTAADGSTLTVAYEGSQGAPSGGVATFAHADTVVGGTGRFAGATGQFSIEGLIDLSGPTVAGTVTGWLSY